MTRRPLSRQAVERMRAREAAAGLEPDDAAAQWLAGHDPPPEPKPSKSLAKNKTLHRWRNRSTS